MTKVVAARGRTRSPTQALRWALTWAVVFTGLHGYWYLGGRIGLGDAPSPLPGAPAGPGAWIFTIVVALMFAVGLAVPIALLQDNNRGVSRRLLVALLWAGCLFLVARGGSGLLDDVIRDVGLSSGGITGLSYKDTLGTAHPSTYTLIPPPSSTATFSSAASSTAGPLEYLRQVDSFACQPNDVRHHPRRVARPDHRPAAAEPLCERCRSETVPTQRCRIYSAAGEDSLWDALCGTPVSARSSPAQNPRFGAARGAMPPAGLAPISAELFAAVRGAAG
jgi:hypothetical protein